MRDGTLDKDLGDLSEVVMVKRFGDAFATVGLVRGH